MSPVGAPSERAITLGIIAGDGRLPFDVAEGARKAGRRVVAVAFRGFADAALESEVDELRWVHLGQVDAVIAALVDVGAREAVLVGKVPKETLFRDSGLLRLDDHAIRILSGLRDRGDDAILRAVGDALEQAGIRTCSQGDFAGHLLAGEGALGAVAPTPEQVEDVRFAWPIAKAIGRLDIGQTLVVRKRSVLAVEAIEGTDAAIRRGAEYGGAGATVVKVWKPTQDPRFDFPTIGPATVETLRDVEAGALAVEAGRTLVVEREETLRLADAAGICVLGYAPPAHSSDLGDLGDPGDLGDVG